ncbi:TPA: hypothetical protein ACPWGV_004942 [Pseudomonas aeruginosa]
MNKVSWGEVNARVDSAASFKQWIQSMHDNILACGLVQTADTGQLDIAGISAVPAAGAYAGYLIYKFADSLASSKPVFIKLRPYVGQAGGSTYLFGNVAVTVGFSTDGAGTMTGINTAEFNFYNSSSGSVRAFTSGATTSYAIHSEGRFALCLGINAYANNVPNNFCMLFLDVTRTLDANGEPTTDGVVVTRNGVPYYSNSTVGPAEMRPAKALLNTTMGAWNQALTPFVGGQDAATAGGNTQIQRTYRLVPALVPDPALTLFWSAAITAGDEYDIAVDGITRHYIALSVNTGLVADAATARGAGFGMLWGDL